MADRPATFCLSLGVGVPIPWEYLKVFFSMTCMESRAYLLVDVQTLPQICPSQALS